MIPRRRLLRISQLALVSLIMMAALGATDASARFERDSHQMMCVCGCNQLLGECNHLGCPDSPAMLVQLSTSISKGESDNQIFHDFQAQYGPVVLAAPMFTRFNHVAWIMPPLLLFLGIAAVMLIVRKWKLHTVPMPPASTMPGHDAVLDRVRRETQL